MRRDGHVVPTLESLEPRFLLSGNPLETDLGDFGDSLSQATEIEVAAENATTIEGDISSIRDVDYFAFTAPVSGGLRVRMEGIEGGVDSYLRAYNASFRAVAANNNLARGTRDSEVLFPVQAGQTYFLRARSVRRTEGEYRLTFTLSEDEGGNSRSDATVVSISSETTTVLSGAIDYRRDNDYLRFVAPVSGGVQITMSAAEGSNVDSYLVVYNSAGRRLAANNNAFRGTRDAQVSFAVQAGETYILRALGARGSHGEYTLSADVSEDLHENSLSGATIVDLDADQTVTVLGSINYRSDQDMFSFVAPVTGGVTIDMAAVEGSNVDSYLVVYNSVGRRITANNNAFRGTRDARAAFYVEAGQSYYVQARGVRRSEGGYVLQFSLSEDEYGSSFATAGSVSLDEDGAALISSAFDYRRDVDVIAVTATHTAEMAVTMSRIDTSVLPLLRIYNSSGRILAADVDRNTAEVEFDATAGETYYLWTIHLRRSVPGAYDISIETDVPAPAPQPDPTVPDPAPAGTVTAAVYAADGGLMLRVLGTNSSDTIVVSQTDTSVTVTGSLTYSYTGTIRRVELYGFGGGDVLQTTYSVTAWSYLYGGAGDDTIYENAQAQACVYGEGGADVLISVGGGTDRLTGGEGLDSVWSDGADVLLDASSAESAAGSLHTISSFYQPWTTNPAGADYVSLDLNGQNLRDPTFTSYASRYENFSDDDVFNNGAQYSDIRQGSVGDCYYLAALSSLAQSDPMILQQMVTSLGDGTFAVRFYEDGREVYLRIDGDLPVYSSGSLTYAKTSSTHEIWAPLVEKAYAYFRYGQNSYASISGGWMDTVYRQVTGGSAQFRYTFGSTGDLADYLRTQLTAGHAVTLGSYSNASSPVVGSHAYQVVSIDAGNNVTVYNPWGVDGRSWDSNYYDGLLELSIGQIQSNYLAVVTSLV